MSSTSAVGLGAKQVDGRFFHSLHQDLASKVEKFGTPKPTHILAVLRKLTPDTRQAYGWENTVISLANPDHGVREIERTFRKLGWDFEAAKIVAGSKPPDFQLFLTMIKDLARYFDQHPVLIRPKNPPPLPQALPVPATTATATSNRERERRPKAKDLEYWAKGSKSGGFKINKERRKRGKVVTIIQDVGGDVLLMLKELRSDLGTGGRYDAPSKSLEMQGDCVKGVLKWLVKKNCLVGVSAKVKQAITAKEDQKKRRDGAKKAKQNAERQRQLEHQRKKNAIDIFKPLSSKELKTMKPDMLKKHLKARGLSTQGTKKELHARLSSFIKEQATALSTQASIANASAPDTETSTTDQTPQTNDSTATVTDTSIVTDNSDSNSWTPEQQKQLEEALVTVKCLDPKRRWKLIGYASIGCTHT